MRRRSRRCIARVMFSMGPEKSPGKTPRHKVMSQRHFGAKLDEDQKGSRLVEKKEKSRPADAGLFFSLFSRPRFL